MYVCTTVFQPIIGWHLINVVDFGDAIISLRPRPRRGEIDFGRTFLMSFFPKTLNIEIIELKCPILGLEAKKMNFVNSAAVTLIVFDRNSGDPELQPVQIM